VRILLVDDDLLTVEILAALLRAEGHEIVVARDGEAAWARFQAEPIECVVTDWMMPGLSGVELARRIRTAPDRSWAYVAMVSGRTESADVVEGLRAGADDFLPKPYDRDVLRARIHVAERVLALERRLRDRVHELEQALSEVRTLRGLLPICMYCHKVRDDADAWLALEHYLTEHASTQFSHGVCPACYREHVDPMLAGLRAAAGAKPG
jgi:DNA-binding response OmpR family regulator